MPHALDVGHTSFEFQICTILCPRLVSPEKVSLLSCEPERIMVLCALDLDPSCDVLIVHAASHHGYHDTVPQALSAVYACALGVPHLCPFTEGGVYIKKTPARRENKIM